MGFALVQGTQGGGGAMGCLMELYPLLISLAPSQLSLVILQA